MRRGLVYLALVYVVGVLVWLSTCLECAPM